MSYISEYKKILTKFVYLQKLPEKIDFLLIDLDNTLFNTNYLIEKNNLDEKFDIKPEKELGYVKDYGIGKPKDDRNYDYEYFLKHISPKSFNIPLLKYIINKQIPFTICTSRYNYYNNDFELFFTEVYNSGYFNVNILKRLFNENYFISDITTNDKLFILKEMMDTLNSNNVYLIDDSSKLVNKNNVIVSIQPWNYKFIKNDTYYLLPIKPNYNENF